MRYALTFLFIVSFGFLKAQYMRADQLPSIIGEIYTNAQSRASIDSNGNLYYSNYMVDMQHKKVYKQPEFYRGPEERSGSRLFYSPNRRYSVQTYYDVWNYPAQKERRKAPKADWRTYVTAIDWENNQVNGKPYDPFVSRDYYEENYTLAITSVGKLVTTDPGKIGKIIGDEPDIRHINGLYLVDPRDGSRKTITMDNIDTRNVLKYWTFLSKDESSVVLVLNRKLGPGDFHGEVISFNISTGARAGFSRRGSLTPVMVGQNNIMSNDFVGKPESSYEMRIIRISDGKVLAEVGMQEKQDELKFDLRSDTLFYFNADNYTLATFVPGKDEMELQSVLSIDTVNLGFAPIFYKLAVFNNSFTLIPFYMPTDHWNKRQYSGYMILFNRKNASPQLAIKPFFHDPQTAANALAAENRKYREECEALKQKSPYKYGTILRRKTGSERLPVIFMGADCVHNYYLIRSAGGNILSGLYMHQFAEYEALGPEYYVCQDCTGSGQITTSFTSANDKWVQVNFNVYVRNKNATKSETVTSICRKCVGHGVIK